ncbi:MAG: hypothetical protein EOP00_36050 [Pedobacter sp.]|nr:MAG: hypothetical protein EOP00_36050 [Pedobacter sp.]
MKLLIALVLLSSFSISTAKSEEVLTSDNYFGVADNSRVEQPFELKFVEKPKFVYAEMLYQVSYGKGVLSVDGKTVSELLKKSVSQSKYRDDGLELMGEDGWELASTLIREINSGFEIFYYFKKQIN